MKTNLVIYSWLSIVYACVYIIFTYNEKKINLTIGWLSYTKEYKVVISYNFCFGYL